LSVSVPHRKTPRFSAEGRRSRIRHHDIVGILPQYEEMEGVGVGVSWRDKRRDFRHYNIVQIFGITTTVCVQYRYYHSTRRQRSRYWRLAEGQTRRFSALRFQPNLRFGVERPA